MTEALHFLTIAEAARRIKARTLSPVALVEALLGRIELLNPQLDAFVTLMGEQALAAAVERIDSETARADGAEAALDRVDSAVDLVNERVLGLQEALDGLREATLR